MGSHTGQITSILIKNNYIYTFSLDGKYSIWKLDTFSRITTINDVHRQGIIYAEIIDDWLLTSGGDLLIKIHSI
jgi:WD40 repeat protein